MLVRPYYLGDARGLDQLIRHPSIFSSYKDEACCTGDPNHPTGVLVYRAGAYVHELEVGSGLRARQRADALANFAVATARAKGLQSAVFLVRGENEPMHRFVKSLGAIPQSEPGDVLYLLTPA